MHLLTKIDWLALNTCVSRDVLYAAIAYWLYRKARSYSKI